jgi:cysteinyl-tRNA synthetase
MRTLLLTTIVLIGLLCGGCTSTTVETPLSSNRLSDVRHWLYLIDVNLDEDTVDLIAASSHDLVVLDFIPSEKSNTDYPMADVIAKLHGAHIPKLILAYIDIGEAEDYRTYWQDGWGVGDPEWIAGEDPDGWDGNFPVAFWRAEWRNIWLGGDGYLQEIVEAGFDGVYLDWIEAYADENVARLADRDAVEPEDEMVAWVDEIAGFTRSQRPGFTIIAQNAAELAARADYRAIIDAISQEQVWFDGGADNDPPGDCPLPASNEEVNTDDYLASLPEPCRAYVEDDPDSTLNSSTEEYVDQLEQARDNGTVIFTVDYAQQPENVAKAYEASRALGFIPFVGTRALDEFQEPYPDE